MSSSPTEEPSTAAGGSIYSLPLLLSLIYDIWVLNLSNTYIWRCSTRSILLPFFKSHVRPQRHLDIGVGTGYYLAHAGFPADADVTLCDINADALEAARKRVVGKAGEGIQAKVLKHDIEAPLPVVEGEGRKYESVSLMYLLHCMPGPLERKVKIFEHLKERVTDSGTLFGATILGKGVRHNYGGRLLMGAYNKKGIFGNEGDGEEGVLEALRGNFEEVEGWIEGVVLLFVARRPRRGREGRRAVG